MSAICHRRERSREIKIKIQKQREGGERGQGRETHLYNDGAHGLWEGGGPLDWNGRKDQTAIVSHMLAKALGQVHEVRSELRMG